MSRPTRAAIVATSALLGALTLTACSNAEPQDTDHGGNHGSDQSTSTVPAADFNDADVMFAQMMVLHHAQAVEMADIVLASADASPEISALAQQIKDAQTSELATLTTWLEEWGADPSGGGGMDHGAMGSEDGMVSEEDLANLASATGPDVDRLFLEHMIAHHEGAVIMAQDEVSNGRSADAIALAEDVIAVQEEEITTMGALLGTLNDMTSPHN